MVLLGSIMDYNGLYMVLIGYIRVYMGHFVSYLCPFRAHLYGMALSGWSIMVYSMLYGAILGGIVSFLCPFRAAIYGTSSIGGQMCHIKPPFGR